MTGDQQDMQTRLRATLPARWFSDTSPTLGGVLAGLAWSWAWLYTLLTTVQAQTRLATATDAQLDGISADSLGAALPRRPTEPDSSYRKRILRERLRERGTRPALLAVLTDLTGQTPIIFEPTRPADTGAWNGPLGYGAAGGWGNMNLPFQFFLTAFRAQGSGVAIVAGYGTGQGCYGGGTIQYANLAMLTGQITDQDLRNAVTSILPVATTAWIRISN
jgi:hypothetical protein